MKVLSMINQLLKLEYEINIQDSDMSLAMANLVTYSQGYMINTLDLVKSSTKVLTKITNQGDEEIIGELLHNGLSETILFLLGKEDLSLLKYGLNLLIDCLRIFNQDIHE